MPSVQLFWRIVMRLMNERTAAALRRAGGDLLDQVAQLGELGAQRVVDVDQVPAGGLLARRCSARRVAARARSAACDSSHARSSLRRRAGVGRRRRRERRRGRRCTTGRRRRGSAAGAPRASATSSRTAGATSSAKRRMSSAEDDRRGCTCSCRSTASARASCSAHARVEPRRSSPLMLSSRRIVLGRAAGLVRRLVDRARSSSGSCSSST